MKEYMKHQVVDWVLAQDVFTANVSMNYKGKVGLPSMLGGMCTVILKTGVYILFIINVIMIFGFDSYNISASKLFYDVHNDLGHINISDIM